MMRTNPDAYRTGRWLFGIGLIGMGIALWTEAGRTWLSLYWPVLVMMAGVAKLLDWPMRHASTGVLLLGVGVCLLMATLGVFGLGWTTLWPGMLIAVGASRVVSALLRLRDPVSAGGRDVC